LSVAPSGQNFEVTVHNVQPSGLGRKKKPTMDSLSPKTWQGVDENVAPVVTNFSTDSNNSVLETMCVSGRSGTPQR
jgi:hypothetical protein